MHIFHQIQIQNTSTIIQMQHRRSISLIDSSMYLDHSFLTIRSVDQLLIMEIVLSVHILNWIVLGRRLSDMISTISVIIKKILSKEGIQILPTMIGLLSSNITND